MATQQVGMLLSIARRIAHGCQFTVTYHSVARHDYHKVSL